MYKNFVLPIEQRFRQHAFFMGILSAEKLRCCLYNAFLHLRNLIKAAERLSLQKRAGTAP